MLRPNINRAFDRMGERYRRKIDPSHFLGRSAFDVPREKHPQGPPVNIRTDGKLFEMEVAVPGFRREELEVTLKNDILTIRGEKSKATEMKDAVYVLEEFDFDSFERSFRLAESIARERITAKYEDGILRLTFVDVPEQEERTYQRVTVA